MRKTLLFLLASASLTFGVLSAGYSPVSYDCTGATSFAFEYQFFEEDDLLVYRIEEDGTKTLLSEGTNAGEYSVYAPNNDYSEGATITTVSTYTNGRIVIAREVDYGQELSIGGDFVPAKPLEQQLDKLAAQIQQVKDSVGRTLVFPATDPAGFTNEFPIFEARAGKIASFDDSGNLTVIDPVNSGTISVDDVTIEQDGQTLQVKDGGIDTAQLADNAVTEAKIETGAVITSKITDGAVTREKIADSVMLYEEYTANLTQSGATLSISKTNGTVLYVTITSSCIVGFESDYETNGVNRVSIDFYTGTNTVTWDTNTVANTYISFSTNGITSTFFRKSGDQKWAGRQ